MVNKFTIFSERNSGSNYLRSIIELNFPELKYTSQYGFKHWWLGLDVPDRPKELNNNTDREIQISTATNPETDDVLFLVLVRNPFEWLKSMYDKPHHLREDLRNSYTNITEFLDMPWICEEKNCMNNHWEQNAGPYLIEEAKNVMDIRNRKYKHFLHLLDENPDYAPANVELVKYEDFPNKLIYLKNKYNLKASGEKIQDKPRSPQAPKLFQSIASRQIISKNEYMRIVAKELDLEQEKRMGYEFCNDITDVIEHVEKDHQVVPILQTRTFSKFVFICDHPCLTEWRDRLSEEIQNALDKNHYDDDIIGAKRPIIECLDKYPVEWDASDNVLYFLFNLHRQPCRKWQNWPSYFIVIQTEVFNTVNWITLRHNYVYNLAMEVWDYSAHNTIESRKQLTRSNWYHVPYPTRSTKRIEKMAENKTNEIRDIDVLFIGTMNERRKNILQPLFARLRRQYPSLNIQIIQEGRYGEEFRKLMRRTKYLINVHYYFDNQALEQARVIPALEEGVTVISEWSPDCHNSIESSHLHMIGLTSGKPNIIINSIESEFRKVFRKLNDEEDIQFFLNNTSTAEVLPYEPILTKTPNDLPMIALQMIVRNEEKNLKWTLPTLQKYFDLFVFVETGSDKDNTLEYIRSFARELPVGKKCIVVERKWIHEFDISRSESLQLCRGRVNYALTIDADDLLWVSPDVQKEDIDRYLQNNPYGLYMILMHDRSINYERIAMADVKKSVMYQFKLHEILSCEDRKSSHNLIPDNLMHIERGKMRGCRSQDKERGNRDIEILRKCLETELPKHQSRYAFYLANELFDNGRYEEALRSYLFRSVLGGYFEEVFYSMYRAGACCNLLDYPFYQTQRQLKLAAKDHPGRVEAHWLGTSFLRTKGRFLDGYQLGKEGLERPWQRRFLFAPRHAYEFGLVNQVAQCAEKCGHESEAALLYLGLLNYGNKAFMPENEKIRMQQDLSTILKTHRPTLAIYTGYTHLFGNTETRHKGGSELMLDNFIRGIQQKFQEKSFDIHVFSSDNTEHLTKMQDECQFKGNVFFHSIHNYVKFVQSRGKPFDIMVIHRYIHGMLDIQPGHFEQLYVWLHDYGLQPAWNGHSFPNNGAGILSWCCSGSVAEEKLRGVIVSSQWHAKVVREQYPFIPPGKVKIIPLFPNMKNDNNTVVSRKKWKFLWISDPSRGFSSFMNIFMGFREKYCPEATLDVYGTAGELLTSQPNKYKQLIEENKVIRVHPFSTDRSVICTAFQEADILLYPLNLGKIRHETFCLTIVEAMLAGCLVIGPRIAALAEHINVERAIALQGNTSEAMYEAILRDIHKVRESGKSDFYDVKLRENAKKYAETNFTMQRFIDQWLKLFTKSAHFSQQ